MNPNELDRLFDDALKRSGGESPLLKGAYETSPLAADHLLLKRSWDYFRHRMKTLEESWKKILESKQEEISALIREIQLMKEHEGDLASENEAYKSFDDEYGRSRAQDYLHFNNQTERLKQAWEDERTLYLKREGDLELELHKIQNELERERDSFKNREIQWKKEMEAVQSQSHRILEQQRKQHEQWASEMALKEEERLHLYAKIDLLRPEVERRDQRIKDLKEELLTKDKEINELTQKMISLVKQNREQDEKYAQMKEWSEILTRERDALKEGWAREQAEWRELWDRERQLWEKKRDL